MLTCKFCGKECKNLNSQTQHERCCRENPDRVTPPEKTEKWKDAMKRRRGNGTNQYTKAKELGLPKPEISEELRTRLSEYAKEQNKTQWTEESRKKHSEAMKNAVKNNPDSYSKNNVCGRIKQHEYNGNKLKGTWELKVAKWLDSMGVAWICECNPHPYIWNNSWHLYFPDFYLSDYNVYIEVKGYKRERDIAKWTQCKDILCIVDKTNIDKLHSYNSIMDFISNSKFQGQ